MMSSLIDITVMQSLIDVTQYLYPLVYVDNSSVLPQPGGELRLDSLQRIQETQFLGRALWGIS